MRVGIVFTAVVLLLAACGPSGSGVTSDSEGSWSRLDSPPLSGRAGPALATVGGRLIVAGGWEFLCPPGADCGAPDSLPFRDGVAYDFSTGTWSPIADAPVGFRTPATAVVGTELFVLSQCEQAVACPAGRMLLRYDGVGDSWQTFDPPSDRGFFRLAAVGQHLVAFSDSDDAGEVSDAWFDTDDETWKSLPDDPFPRAYDRQVVDHDGTVLLFGSPIERTEPTKLAAVFDPLSWSWTELPDSDAHGFQVWRSGGLLYLNPHFGNAEGAVFDPATRTWAAFPDTPGGDSWRNDMAGIIGDDDATFEYASGWVYDSDHGHWVMVRPRPDADSVSDETITAAGQRLVVFGGQSWPNGVGQLVNTTWVWDPPPPVQ